MPENTKAVEGSGIYLLKDLKFPPWFWCLGRKHVAIRGPPNGGSQYYNCKGFHSIVLMALVDADYKCLFADVGAPCCCSDGGVFSTTALKKALEDNYCVGLLKDEPLPKDDKHIPYFLIGDNAFPLRPWILKPYPHRNMTIPECMFNYRLSRARRV